MKFFFRFFGMISLCILVLFSVVSTVHSAVNYETNVQMIYSPLKIFFLGVGLIGLGRLLKKRSIR